MEKSNRKNTLALVMAVTLLLMAPMAVAGIGLEGADVSTAGGHIMISPEGNGDTLASKGATLEIFLYDGVGNPIAGYPYQDIWLGDMGTGEINLCLGGSVADANTDIGGITHISGTLFGGGYTATGTAVYIAGVQAFGGTPPPLPITVNSPDISGDRVVNLVDVGLFATDLLAGYHFRSDLVHSGVVDLSDIGRFVAALGEACP